MRLLFLFLIFSQVVNAQKYFTRTGLTEFKASIDAFEPVEAKNNSCSVILNTNTGDIAALIPINAFKFKIALMQEHFNENYMDSDKFPKATFKGKVENFNKNNLDTKKKHQIKGILTIRNISKNIDISATFHRIDTKTIIKSNFKVKPEDFGIEIPSVVRKKIAKTINISLNYELTEKK